MMKQILWAALLLPITALGQKAYTLKGKVDGADSPAKMYLCYQSAKGEIQFDSTGVNRGEFKFEGFIDQPRKASLMLAHHTIKLKWFKEVMVNAKDDIDFRNESIDIVTLYLEPGTTTLTSADSVFKAKITGSQLNNDLSELNQERAQAFREMKSVIATFNNINKEGRITEAEALGLERGYKKGQAHLRDIDISFAQKHTSSFITLDVLATYIETEAVGKVIEPLFKSLKPNLRNSAAGKLLAAKIVDYKVTDIGQLAPVFVQPDTTGTPVSLSSFKGKYTLIDFWASWCGPCRNENPSIIYYYQQYKDKNFTILGISIDKAANKDKWLAAIKQDHIGQWTQVSDLKGGNNNAAAAMYHINSIPQNILVGPNGRIIAKNLHGSGLSDALGLLLK